MCNYPGPFIANFTKLLLLAYFNEVIAGCCSSYLMFRKYNNCDLFSCLVSLQYSAESIELLIEDRLTRLHKIWIFLPPSVSKLDRRHTGRLRKRGDFIQYSLVQSKRKI